MFPLAKRSYDDVMIASSVPIMTSPYVSRIPSPFLQIFKWKCVRSLTALIQAQARGKRVGKNVFQGDVPFETSHAQEIVPGDQATSTGPPAVTLAFHPVILPFNCLNIRPHNDVRADRSFVYSTIRPLLQGFL